MPKTKQLVLERDMWRETAKQAQRNTEYYRGLLVQIGEFLGPEAYISDDGSVQDDVIVAKLPEMIERGGAS